MIDILIAVLVILFTIFIIVVVHEYGHFVMARKLGIAVDEFSIGMGPKLYEKHIKETAYTIRALPIGGYVKLREGMEYQNDENSFYNAHPLKKILISLGGPLFNLILAWIIFSIVLVFGIQLPATNFSEKYIDETNTFIVQIMENSPAERVGLPSQVEITSIVVNNEVITVSDISNKIADNSLVTIEYIDSNKELKSQSITPIDGIIGVSFQDRGTLTTNILDAPIVAFVFTKDIIVEFWKALSGFIFNSIWGSEDKSTSQEEVELIGPIGIGQYLINIASTGFLPLLFFIAFLSVNIGLINLIPIPALDGWRILTAFFELILNKKMNPKIDEYLLKFGFIFLILILIWVTIGDVLHIW